MVNSRYFDVWNELTNLKKRSTSSHMKKCYA